MISQIIWIEFYKIIVYSLLLLKKNINLFLNINYGYNKKNVILTGLPIYDNLYWLSKKIKTEKLLFIVPTWRMNIKGTNNLIAYESIHSDTFKKYKLF